MFIGFLFGHNVLGVHFPFRGREVDGLLLTVFGKDSNNICKTYAFLGYFLECPCLFVSFGVETGHGGHEFFYQPWLGVALPLGDRSPVILFQQATYWGQTIG